MKAGKKSIELWQEGILFLLMGTGLLAYSIDSYEKSFLHDWKQSPYLFPLIISGIFIALSLCLLFQGRKPGKEPEGSGIKKKGNIKSTALALVITFTYYLAMSWLKLPYITLTIAGLSLVLGTFEIVTIVFLIIMMLFLGMKKPLILCLAPLLTTLCLSVIFRSFLHVLLP